MRRPSTVHSTVRGSFTGSLGWPMLAPGVSVLNFRLALPWLTVTESARTAEAAAASSRPAVITRDKRFMANLLAAA
jgi:hypothetical protein